MRDSYRLKMLLGVLALAALPFVLGNFGQAWVRVAAFAMLYVILALGLNIVVGFAGLLDLGFVAFYAIGAYLYALLASPHFMEYFGWQVSWSIWAVIPLAALTAAGFGVLLGAPTLKLRGDYLAVVTLGFGEIIYIVLRNGDSPVNFTGGPQGIGMIAPVSLAGLSFLRGLDVGGWRIPGIYLYFYLFTVIAAATYVACQRLQHSKLGRAWAAVRDDEIAAKAMGINTRNVKLVAFASGASFGGIAGALFAAVQGFVSPESFVLSESIIILAMVVLGGMGHLPGVVLGAILLTLLPELLRQIAGPVQEALLGAELVPAEVLRMIMYGLALVLVMLLRPKGLWPEPPPKEGRVGDLAELRTAENLLHSGCSGGVQ